MEANLGVLVKSSAYPSPRVRRGMQAVNCDEGGSLLSLASTLVQQPDFSMLLHV